MRPPTRHRCRRQFRARREVPPLRWTRMRRRCQMDSRRRDRATTISINRRGSSHSSSNRSQSRQRMRQKSSACCSEAADATLLPCMRFELCVACCSVVPLANSSSFLQQLSTNFTLYWPRRMQRGARPRSRRSNQRPPPFSPWSFVRALHQPSCSLSPSCATCSSFDSRDFRLANLSSSRQRAAVDGAGGRSLLGAHCDRRGAE